ncbi:hypothetical protein GCM10027418_31820 [Mariniluteicoccus endophyticus]
MDHDLRIGDVERDDAARLLQEHLTAGRLDHEEFALRMEGALRATHRSQLDELFLDLPGRRPGATVPQQAAPLPAVAKPAHHPWFPYAIGALAVGSVVSGMALVHEAMDPDVIIQRGGRGGRHGHLPPEVIAEHLHFPWMPLLLFVLVVGTLAFVLARRATTPSTTAGPRPSEATLTGKQRAAIDREVRAGHRVRAIKLFREATGAGLKDATMVVSAWERRMKARG